MYTKKLEYRAIREYEDGIPPAALDFIKEDMRMHILKENGMDKELLDVVNRYIYIVNKEVVYWKKEFEKPITLFSLIIGGKDKKEIAYARMDSFNYILDMLLHEKRAIEYRLDIKTK